MAGRGYRLPPDERRCVAKSTTTQERCTKWAIAGGTVCPTHGGSAPMVKTRAAVRAELGRWGLGDPHVDAGETLLRLVSQSATRCERYSRLLEDAYDASARLERGDTEVAAKAVDDLNAVFATPGLSALISVTYSVTPTGQRVATGESISALVRLEGEERDRCANFCRLAVAAGLAERQVRIAERYGVMIAGGFKALIERLGLTTEQMERAPLIAAQVLRELEAA